MSIRDAFAAVPWWTVLLVVVAARLAVDPNWSIVAALALLSVRGGLRNVLAHQLELKQAADTDRLARLETEVRSLVQATNFKNLRG